MFKVDIKGKKIVCILLGSICACIEEARSILLNQAVYC